MRVWVAGCSTGEEAYSAAILLHETMAQLEGWEVIVYATDINPAALGKATAGTYSDWSFRTTPESVRANYFRSTDHNRWTVIPEIRRLVRFSYLNLVDEVYPSIFAVPGMFDLIFCRNVLMYFSADFQQTVLRRLRPGLVADGRLILGPCDSTFAVHDLFDREPDCPTVFRLKRAPRVGESVLPEIVTWESPAAPSPVKLAPEPLAEAFVPEKLPRIEPRAEETLAEGARQAADAGEYETALQLCDKAIAAEKLNAAHHFLRACILIELGRVVDAEAALRSVLYLDPDYVMAHFTLGTLARMQQREEAAGHHFRRAEELLARFHAGEAVPGGDGMTAARFQSVLAAAGRMTR